MGQIGLKSTLTHWRAKYDNTEGPNLKNTQIFQMNLHFQQHHTKFDSLILGLS